MRIFKVNKNLILYTLQSSTSEKVLRNKNYIYIFYLTKINEELFKEALRKFYIIQLNISLMLCKFI